MDENLNIETCKSVKKGFMYTFKKDYLSRWGLYLFLLLPIIYVLVFNYYPMLGVQIAFKKYDFSKGIWGSPWVGFYQFGRLVNSPDFLNILKNTIFLSFYGIIASFPLPIMFALLINAFPKKRYKKFVQSVSYMPHFISTLVMVGLLMQLFNPRIGVFSLVNQFFTGNMIKDLFSSPTAFPHLYVWSGVWQGIGWSSIIYLAALSGVDLELHEAAQIDGASRFQRILNIDFPAILPTATILLILSAGNIMSIGFEKAYAMQNALNIGSSEIISTYVYKIALTTGSGDFSFATAIGLFNSVINFIILISVNAAAKKLSETSLW